MTTYSGREEERETTTQMIEFSHGSPVTIFSMHVCMLFRLDLSDGAIYGATSSHRNDTRKTQVNIFVA